MKHLTERRLAKIEPLVKRLLETMRERGARSVSPEQELCEALNMQYKDLQNCMKELLKHDTFAPVAAITLENSARQGYVRSPYRVPLAKLYGARHYDHDDLPSKRNAWFASFGIEY